MMKIYAWLLFWPTSKVTIISTRISYAGNFYDIAEVHIAYVTPVIKKTETLLI